MSAPLGHPGALRRLRNSHPQADQAKAVAVVAVTASSLYCGKQGLERGTNYLLALFPTRLVILRPMRRPEPQAVLVDLAKGTYRITDVVQGGLNTSFVVARPYGNVALRMLRRAWYSVNDDVLATLVAAAASAERAARRSPAPPLRTAGDVRVFARMCAAHGPGAESATAVAEAEVIAGTLGRGRPDTPAVLLATFPDRLVLLDRGATTHVRSTPVAEIARGAAAISVTEQSSTHLTLTIRAGTGDLLLRVSRYGEDRIDTAVRNAVLAVGSGGAGPRG